METDEIVPSEDEEESANEASSDDDDSYTKSSIFQKTNSIKSSKLKKAHIPSIQEVEQAIIDQKKRDLLKQYASDDLIEAEAEVKKLAGSIV